MSICCKVYIVFCLVIVDIATEIERNTEKKECISIAMANQFVVFFGGVAVGVALLMGLTKVKASDTDSKVNQQTKKLMNVYVFQTGKFYHSSKCISSQREKNDRLQEPTEMKVSQAQENKNVECVCIGCVKFFRSSA